MKNLRKKFQLEIKGTKRVNIGSGQTPTPGWLNYDNSLSIRLAKYPDVVSLLSILGLLNDGQISFISFAHNHDIRWADATKHIPLPDNSVEVLYTSHMVEHLSREEVKLFLREGLRVLQPRGIIRIAFPDIKKMIDQYITSGDADSFVEKTCMSRNKPKTIVDKLKYLIVGDRGHLWMYDCCSMGKFLSEIGYREPRKLEPGLTTIPNPGKLNLFERAEESAYIEAYKP